MPEQKPMNRAPGAEPQREPRPQYDAVVVGAGLGGVYAIYRLLREGLSVLCLEAAGGLGGVWLHNRYPGARVDVESFDYCYQFSRDLFDTWRWSERYASQGEILRYINHVADRFDLRRHVRFNAALESAQWRPEFARYDLTVSGGRRISARFLVMATGNLSAPRAPSFSGLLRFRGEWVQSSRWPDRDVAIKDRRVAVVGTGSSGVQIVPVVAREARHLYVFQRTPNYSVPARNGPLDGSAINAMVADFGTRRERLLSTRAGNTAGLDAVKRYDQYTPDERAARLAHVWSLGGQRLNRVFTDQGVDSGVNDVVADFVRDRIREVVKDPETAEALCPRDHPIGTRRLCMDSGYYETFNRSNVTLVDASVSPIEEITESGIRTRSGDYAVDLIIFALGFHAFRGAMDRIAIRNPAGEHPTDCWKRGPRTLLGLMTTGFPNFFFLTGPGSPSVLANMVLMNEEHVNFVAEMIAHMRKHDFAIVEPRPEAVSWWTEQVSAAASKLLRLHIANYMVHVNGDGSRVFMPYAGGIDAFSRTCRQIADENYACFSFARSAPTMGMSSGERSSTSVS
jgi:cation diffusion facilitator CzcD-associated flavoprotein CzcO